MSLELQIKEAVNDLSQTNLPYEDLCWMLAELQLRTQAKNFDVSESDIRKKADEIIKSKVPIEKLHWKIAELNLKNK